MVPFSLPNVLGSLFTASVQTIALAGGTIVFATAIGLALALGSTSGSRALQVPIGWFSAGARAIPDLLVLLFTFYGLTQVGIQLDPLPAAMIALTFTSCAYYLEIFRSGLLAIPPSQYEAARALGIPRHRMMARIILPQVVKIIRQPYTSQMTIVVKNTALASVVAVPEILAIATRIAISTGRPFEVLFLGSLVFALINSALLTLGTLGRRSANATRLRESAVRGR